jgi:hypothetical protein
VPAIHDPHPQGHAEAACARQWLALAIAVLVLAGLFSLIVVIGRMPPFDRLVTDPLFFKRGLVVHVNLALVAWFYSFIAALLFLVPGPRPPGPLVRLSTSISGAGVLMMLIAAGLPGTRPVLSNYIPMIDHWLFALGQIAFGIGVLASFLPRVLLPGGSRREAFLGVPGAAQVGLRATALALVVAVVTFGISWWKMQGGLAAETYYELLVWGGGHVLQLACSVAMVTVWLALLGSALGASPVSRPAASWLFGALIAPWLLSPFLALGGTWSEAYRVGFTHLMQWSIFPVVGIFLVLCCRGLVRGWRDGRIGAPELADPRISVTAAFMTLTYLLMGAFGFSIPTPRLRRAAAWQPVVFGVGQMIFAGGFALAGAYGMTRKAYGAEQAARGAVESAGLAVMGIGGLLAVVGGVLFLGVVVAIWRRGSEHDPRTEASLARDSWRYRWAREIQIASLRSRG